MALRAGEWVEVRSKEEILRTLDKNGRLENMPFMPEMFAYCGKRLRVYKRAHKACDTINPHSLRGLPSSVLLGNIRCNGSAHGGCQAQCSIFWKNDWLKPLSVSEEAPTRTTDWGAPAAGGCTEEDVFKATRGDPTPSGETCFRCQATDFPAYTTRIRMRDVGQYVEDYRSGNVSLREMLLTTCYFVFKFLGGSRFDKDSSNYAKLYDRFQALVGGNPYPRRRGHLDAKEAGPVEALDLQPGDLVRVKAYDDILATLNRTSNKNRGLYFDAEMVPFCGKIFRVRSRVEQFLDEKTGVMLTMKTPAVILEGGWCRAFYSEYRPFCPRAIYAWWREIWLERVSHTVEPAFTDSDGSEQAVHPAVDANGRPQ